MNPRRLEIGVQAVTALVIVSVAVALAGLTWRLLGDPGGKPQSLPAMAAGALVAPPVDLAPIFSLSPFGQAVSDTPTGQGDAAALGLQLRGIVHARNSAASSALISVGGAPAKPFAVGEAVAGGLTVEAIEADAVVLGAGGRRERLGFPTKVATLPADGAGIAAIRAAVPPSVSGLPPAPAVQPPGNSAAAAGAAVEAYRDRLAAGPQTLIGTLGAVATPQGYRIGPNLSSDMRSAGLQPGDIVQTINGAAVGDAERDRRLFEQAVASGQARIAVLRDGRQITMSFPLR